MSKCKNRLLSAVLSVAFLAGAGIMISSAAEPASQDTQPSSIGVYGGYVHPHWSPDGTEFWYESFGRDLSRQFWWVNAISGKRLPAFNCVKLAAALDKSKVVSFDPDFIVLNDMQKLADGRLQLNLAGNQFTYNPSNNDLHFVGPVKSVPRPLLRLETAIPSDERWELTTVTFVNRSNIKGSLWSVDGYGNQKRMGELEVGWMEYAAYVGSVFAIKDERGAILGAYQAVADPSQADLDSVPAKRPTTQSFVEAGESNDRKWVASVRGGNVFLLDRTNGHEWPLTASVGMADGGLVRLNRVHWSPDSSRLFAVGTNYAGQPAHLVQSSPDDQLQPRLLPATFVRAIDPIWSDEPHIFDPVSRREIPIDHTLLPEQFEIREASWDMDSKEVIFSCVDRGKQWVRLVSLDVATGKLRVLLNERSDTFVDFSSSEKSNFIWSSATKEFLWTSERDGWNHVYLYDSVSGKLKNQITRGPWVVRDFLQIHPISRILLLKVGGLVRGEDPYNIHICRIKFDGTGLLDLTPADGSHSVEFSPDDRFYLDTYSRVDLPPVTELRRSSDAALICIVDKADWSERLAAGWIPPERFVAKGRDGTTDIYGVIYRPFKFEATKKYPVIESIYAGPQAAYVPKQFVMGTWEMQMAGRRFIVVQIDGMGTNYRSKAFHDVCWHNLADAGFPDRIPWIKAAAGKHPEMDLSRIGIYGASAGAENAIRALESHGDFYNVAVAECGCYDDRLAAQSEEWMGWPIGPWYAEQADVADAAKINGKLLLIDCELDHVVDPASTMQMVNALVKANKDFDMLVVPNADHGQIGEYGFRRCIDFFSRNLSGDKPAEK